MKFSQLKFFYLSETDLPLAGPPAFHEAPSPSRPPLPSSSASSRSHWGLPDLNCRALPTEIWRSQLRSRSAHVRENVTSNVRSQIECLNRMSNTQCQTECQNRSHQACRNRCQLAYQQECQTECQRKCQNRCQIGCWNRCQI